MRNSTCLPLRTAVLVLAVLLALTPVSQVLAQTEQQEQQSQASQSDKQDEEPDKAAILRPGATAIFPVADSIPVADAAAAVPAAPLSSTELVILIGVIFLIIILISCFAGGGCSPVPSD